MSLENEIKKLFLRDSRWTGRKEISELDYFDMRGSAVGTCWNFGYDTLDANVMRLFFFWNRESCVHCNGIVKAHHMHSFLNRLVRQNRRVDFFSAQEVRIAVIDDDLGQIHNRSLS